MTINEYKQAYKSLTMSQVRHLAETSSEFKVNTETLYRMATGSALNKNCTECWVDAYAILATMDESKFEALSSRKFDLRAGALLIDSVNADNSKMCTRNNLTDELALYHLKTNPNCIKMFSKYPENWQELASAFNVKPTKKRKTKKQ